MRSTRTRTRFASSSESGLFSGNSGTNESTASSVSLSMNTCLMNFSAEKQSTASSSPQEPWGKLARICSQYLPAELRQAPAGSTIWVCTSKMNSLPANASAAAAVSNAPSSGTRNTPPVLPIAAKASFSVSNVVAAPQSDCKNARRPSPTRLACSPIRRSASRLARVSGSASGTGRNSPLEVESTLTGNGPLTVPMASCLSAVEALKHEVPAAELCFRHILQSASGRHAGIVHDRVEFVAGPREYRLGGSPDRRSTGNVELRDFDAFLHTRVLQRWSSRSACSGRG